jgi:hypothetical protein
MAAFLIGTAASASRRDTVAPVTGQRSWGFYFMDKWKVTDKLTVNVGLRYDLMLWPGYGSDSSDPTSQVGNIDFNNGTYVIQTNSPDCASTGQAPCLPGGVLPDHVVVSKNNRLYSNTYDNIQPRIGIAYSLNDKTVVRASFGMFNDLWAGVMQTVQGIGGDWPSIAQILSPALNTSNQVATVNWQDPLAGLGSAGLPAATPFGQESVFGTMESWSRAPVGSEHCDVGELCGFPKPPSYRGWLVQRCITSGTRDARRGYGSTAISVYRSDFL